MATPYVHEAAFDEGYLKVGSIHQVYYSQYGKRDGAPVIFLHGGPGAGTSASNAQYFDPSFYRVVLLDQRGAGNSTPAGEVQENTTQNLVADVEALREHLNIERWYMVFGGSWGSMLALAYSETHPEKVQSLVVRGIFTGRLQEIQWHEDPMGKIKFFPEAHAKWLSHLPLQERGDPRQAYFKRLFSEDFETQSAAAKYWDEYGTWPSRLRVTRADIEGPGDLQETIRRARIDCHYDVNHFFVEDGELFREENIGRIRHIPMAIVQGRYDMICPMQTAWELHQLMPQSELHIISDAGHKATEPGTTAKLIELCDVFKNGVDSLSDANGSRPRMTVSGYDE